MCSGKGANDFKTNHFGGQQTSSASTRLHRNEIKCAHRSMYIVSNIYIYKYIHVQLNNVDGKNGKVIGVFHIVVLARRSLLVH